MDIAFLKSALDQGHYPPPDRPEIAFAGRSNVGKSSLINKLVGRKGIARTSSRPGRTQAINFFGVDQRLYLVDLPGYGFARVPLKVKKSWRRMIETYLTKRSNLKAVVVILDIRRELGAGDRDLLGWLNHQGITVIPVLTKADKVSRDRALRQTRLMGRRLAEVSSVPIIFSAKTGQGREEIWERIEQVILI